MFEVRKPEQKTITLIRAASGAELSEYEKQKLATIENNAQENRIESISVNGKRIDAQEKEVNIELGKFAFKEDIGPADITSDDLFVIKCELEDYTLTNTTE